MLDSEKEFKESDVWAIRNEYTPEEIKKLILEKNEDGNRIGRITKNVRDDAVDDWMMAERGQRWSSVEQWIGTYHEFELSRKLRVPFDIGQDRHYAGDMSGNFGFTLESHFEELSQDNPEVLKKQAKMDLLRRRMAEQPAEFKKQGQIMIENHVIPMTKGELVEAGLDPDLMGWKSLEQVKHEDMRAKASVTAKAIAHATMGLPKRAIDGAKGLVTKEKDENQR